MPRNPADDPGFRSVVENLLDAAEWNDLDHVISELLDIFDGEYFRNEIESALDEMMEYGLVEICGDMIALN